MGFSAVSRTKNFRNTYVGEVLIDSGEITVKSCSTLSERLREWAGYVDSGKAGRGKRTLPYCGSLLLWLQTSWESFEFRRKEGSKYLRERRKSMGVLQGGPDGFFVGFGKEQASFRLPSLFSDFPLACALPLSNLLLDSHRLLPSPNLIISLETVPG